MKAPEYNAIAKAALDLSIIALSCADNLRDGKPDHFIAFITQWDILHREFYNCQSIALNEQESAE